MEYDSCVNDPSPGSSWVGLTTGSPFVDLGLVLAIVDNWS